MGKVLSAQGSGYFPTCIQESTDGRYAIFSLQDAMAIYWRVNVWSFTADVVKRITNFPNEGEVTDVSISTSIPYIPSGQNEESELVCNSYFSTNNVEIFFDSPTKVDELYYPGIYGIITDSANDLEYAFSAVNSTYGNSFAIAILGTTIQISVGILNSEYEEEIISCNASLVPIQWWSYGGTYNTSTGARL